MRLKAPYSKTRKVNKNSQLGIFNREQIIKKNNFFAQFEIPMKISKHRPDVQATLGSFKKQLKSSYKNKKRSQSAIPQQNNSMNEILTVSQVNPLQIFNKESSYNKFHKAVNSRYTTKSHSNNQSKSKFSKISTKNNNILFIPNQRNKCKTESIDYQKYENYITDQEFVPIGKLLTKEIQEENQNQSQFLTSKESKQRMTKTSREYTKNNTLLHRLNFHNPSERASPTYNATSHKLSLLLERFRSNIMSKKQQKLLKKRSQILYPSSSPKIISKKALQKRQFNKIGEINVSEKPIIEPWEQN